MKRAVVEIQFNWIFIIIAGALILTLFVSIARVLIKSSDASFEYDVITYMDEIFTGAETSIDSERTIILPKDMEITCDYYNVLESEYEGNSLQSKIVFAPRFIRSEALLYANYWKMPFASSSFLFISSPLTQFVFIQSPTYNLMELMPEHVNKITIPNVGAFSNHNNYFLKFVYMNSMAINAPPAIPGVEMSAINVRPQSGLEGWGYVDYYKYDESDFVLQGTVAYAGREMLLGALYTDYESYLCNVQKAIDKHRLVVDVLIDHVTQVAQNYNCPDGHSHYISARNKLIQLRSAEIKDMYNIAYGLSGLSHYNSELELKSCPLVY